MSNSDAVDTKIIEAKFDAKDFEKGVNKTIKKLDELKKSLNMKDSSKSITDFAKETTAATEKTASAMEKLSNRMTTFVGQIKQQLVSGLASEVTGAFFQMQQSINGFFKSITTGSINTGMSRYTEILNSVRTMTAAGKDQGQAYQQIKRLAEYSDQTSYSLSTMAGSMSKMVAAGAGLEDARKSVEGLANMAAAAGVNIYDATRAFTNFTQAYSSGSMRLQDWMSFEALNMSTENTMKIFQQAAVQAGTLKKEMKTTIKDGKKIQQEVFKTTNKTNKKVTAGKQVAIKGFRDSLRYGWLDQETMRIATGVLSYVDDLGISVDKLSKEQLEEFANKAYLAAKEARSFSDVMGTVRDVLATGWSNTFENIFGKLDKATEFFTQLADSNLLSILYDLSEYRNEIFEEWNRLTVDGKNGSDLFKEAILNIDEAIGAVTEKFKLLVPSASSVGDWLFLQTKAFNEATAKITEWLNSSDSGFSRATKIAKALQSIGIVLHFVGRVVGTVWNGVSTVWKAASPIFDAVLKALMNFSTHLYRLDRDTTIFDDLSNAFNNVAIAAKPIVDAVTPVIGVLEKIAEFFVDTALSTATMNVQMIADALGFIIEIFGGKSAQQLKSAEGGILNRIKQSIVDLKTAIDSCFGATKEFFGGLLDDLKKLLGIGDQVAGEEGGFFQNVQKFFETNQFVADTKAWIDQAITDIGNFVISIPERIKQFGINIGDYIYGLFWSKETVTDVDEKGNKITGTIEVTTPFKKWLDTILENIRTFIVSIPEKVKKLANNIGTFAGTVLNSITDFLFGEEETTTIKWGHNDGNQWVVDRVETVTARFFTGSGLYKVIESVKAFIKSIPKRVSDGLGTVGSIISAFWEGLFWKEEKVADVDEKGKKIFKKITVKTALHRWLERAIKDVKEFIKSIPSKISAGIKGVGSLLKTFVGALFGKENGEEMTSQELMDALKKPFEGLSLSSVIGTIKNIGLEFMNAIVSIFTGTDDLETNKQKLSEKVAGAITWVKEKAEGAWKTVSDFFVNLPHTIASFFNPEKTGEEINRETADPSPIQKAISDFGNTVGGFIAGIPDNLLTFVDNTVYELGRLWTRIYHAITGQGEYKENYDPRLGKDPQNKKLINTINEMAPDVSEVKVSQWDLFATHLGQTISNIFAKIPTFIAQGIDLAIRGIDAAINWFGEFFKDDKVADKIAEGADVSEEIEKGLEESADETAKEQSPLAVAIGNIASSISKLITQTIPGTLSNAWGYVRDHATEWKDKIAEILDANGITWEKVQEKVEALGTKISEYIAKLPEYIKIGADFFDRLWNGVWVEGRDVDETGKKFFKVRSGGLKQTIQNFVYNFGSDIKDAFSGIGKFIIDGFNTALEWVNKGLNWITNFFNSRDKNEPISESLAKAVGKESGENKELAESMQTFGNTLRITLVDTIPPFIEAGVDEVAAKVPSLLDRILGILIPSASAEEAEKAAEAGAKAVSDAIENNFTGPNLTGDTSASSNPFAHAWNKDFPSKEESKDGEERADGAKSFLEHVSGLFSMLENIGNDPVIHLAVLVGLVAVALNAIKDLLAVSDNMEELGEGVKATGIGIALAAVGAIIGEMAYFVASNDTEKLKQAEGVLNTIASVIERIMDKVMLIVALSTGGDLLETIGKGIDLKASLGKGVVKAGATATASGIASGLIAGVLGGFTVGGLIASVDDFITNFMAPFNSLASGLKTFAENMGPALKNIADMNNDLASALSFPKNFYDFLKGMMQIIGPNAEGTFELGDNAFEYMDNLRNQNGYNISDITKALTERQDLIFGIGAFFKNLSTGLQQYGSLKDPSKTISDITKLVGSDEFGTFLQTMNRVFNTWLEPFGGDHLKDISLELDYMGSALGVFTNSFDSLTEDNVNALQGSLKVLEQLAYAISGGDTGENLLRNITTGQSNIAKFGSQIQQFGSNMKLFFNSINGIQIADEAEAQALQTKLNMVISVVRGFAAAAANAFNQVSIEALDSLTDKMDGLGTKIATFVNNIGWAIDPAMDEGTFSKIQMAVEAFANLTEAIYNLDNVNITNGKNKIDEFLQAMFGADTNDPNTILSYISEFTRIMNAAITDDMELSPTITPIVHMDDVDAAFAERFGPNWQFNMGGIFSAAQQANPENVSENQNENTFDWNLLPTKNQVASMLVYLDAINSKTAQMGKIEVDSEAAIGYFGPLLDQYLGQVENDESRR